MIETTAATSEITASIVAITMVGLTLAEVLTFLSVFIYTLLNQHIFFCPQTTTGYLGLT
jgi:hypothetical protein